MLTPFLLFLLLATLPGLQGMGQNDSDFPTYSLGETVKVFTSKNTYKVGYQIDLLEDTNTLIATLNQLTQVHTVGKIIDILNWMTYFLRALQTKTIQDPPHMISKTWGRDITILIENQQIHPIEKRQTGSPIYLSIGKEGRFIDINKIPGCRTQDGFWGNRVPCLKKYLNLVKEPKHIYVGEEILFALQKLAEKPISSLRLTDIDEFSKILQLPISETDKKQNFITELQQKTENIATPDYLIEYNKILANTERQLYTTTTTTTTTTTRSPPRTTTRTTTTTTRSPTRTTTKTQKTTTKTTKTTTKTPKPTTETTKTTRSVTKHTTETTRSTYQSTIDYSQPDRNTQQNPTENSVFDLRFEVAENEKDIKDLKELLMEMRKSLNELPDSTQDQLTKFNERMLALNDVFAKVTGFNSNLGDIVTEQEWINILAELQIFQTFLKDPKQTHYFPNDLALETLGNTMIYKIENNKIIIEYMYYDKDLYLLEIRPIPICNDNEDCHLYANKGYGNDTHYYAETECKILSESERLCTHPPQEIKCKLYRTNCSAVAGVLYKGPTNLNTTHVSVFATNNDDIEKGLHFEQLTNYIISFKDQKTLTIQGKKINLLGFHQQEQVQVKSLKIVHRNIIETIWMDHGYNILIGLGSISFSGTLLAIIIYIYMKKKKNPSAQRRVRINRSRVYFSPALQDS